MSTAFESIKRGLQEAIEHAERYKPAPLEPRAEFDAQAPESGQERECITRHKGPD